MSTPHSTLIIGILFVLMAIPVHAQDADIQTKLIEQGQYWQARFNSQREAEVWQKVLHLDPDQIDALYGMGLIGVRQNQPGQAQEYLARLQALSPLPWQARQLEQDIALMAPGKQALLEEARRLAGIGEHDQASAVFARMLGGLTPQGAIGGEYYDNLAYNPATWPEARRGMERLMRERPDDSSIALLYAKQLIRREGSRAQGVRLLSRLSQRADISSEAAESWRLALIWSGPPNAAQVPLFEEFLRAHPNDQEIRALLNKGRQQMAQATASAQQNPLVLDGLSALENSDPDEAEQAFQQRLATHPDDPDALGGLGVVRQRQNRYGEAEQLLIRAISKGGRQWQAALDSVRYWKLLRQARDLQAKGEITRAEDAVAQAMRLNPDLPDGRLTLADLQAQAGQYAKASANYRQVLAAQPGHPQALRGLIDVLAQSGQTDDALRLLDSLSAEEQAKFGDAGRLRALRWAQLARVAEERGDIAAAQEALQEALREEPDNVWTRFNLARLYARSGEPLTARVLIDAFLVTNPDNIEALYTRAMLSVELEQWQEAQHALARIPAAYRTAAMNDLDSQITLTLHIRQALALARSGQRQQALAQLDRLQSMAGSSSERTAMLALAYADADDVDRAQEMLRALMQNGTPSNDLLLQYAGVLLKAGEDVQVYTLLSGLEGQPMGVPTRKHYDDILYLYRVRQAERLREDGDLVTAYDMLAPALVQRPGDVAATSTLARMYISNGDNAKALELYKPLALRNPDDPSVLLGAANAAVLTRDHAYANRTLSQFSRLKSTDPAALTDAARIYHAMGKHKKAMALLREAVVIEQIAQRDAPGVGSNPFLTQRAQVVHMVAAAVPPPAKMFLASEPALAVTRHDVPLPAAYLARPRAIALGNQPIAGNRGTQAVPAVAHTALAQRNRPVMEQPRPMPLVAQAMPRAPSQAPSAPRAQPLRAEDGTSPAQRMLDDIQRSRAAHMTQGMTIRSNDNESGLSRMSDVEIPFEANLTAGDGRLALRVTPVALDAGNILSDEAGTRFGGGGASAIGVGAQRDEGVGLGIAYARPGFKADIGSTPIGFKYNTVVAGVSIERPFSGNAQMHYGASLSRRVVTESLTAFAGATDLRDGLSWGGVTANGGRLQLGYDDDEVGVYSYAGLYRLLGHNVKSNTRGELGGGVYRHLQNEPDNKFIVGLSATALGHANNQGFYTYGHGGYFSPRTYFTLGVPVTWAQRSDRFTYQLKGLIGIHSSQQSGADYFPTDAIRQAASGERYPEQSSSGLSYSLEAAGEYRFGHKLFVGGAFALDNSRDYRQYNLGMYLRYLFKDMPDSPLALPLSPYRSPYLD